MCVVESGGVVSFTQLRGDDVSVEMEVNCIYIGTETKKGSKKEDESVTVHEEGDSREFVRTHLRSTRLSPAPRRWLQGPMARRCSAGAINKINALVAVVVLPLPAHPCIYLPRSFSPYVSPLLSSSLSVLFRRKPSISQSAAMSPASPSRTVETSFMAQISLSAVPAST